MMDYVHLPEEKDYFKQMILHIYSNFTHMTNPEPKILCLFTWQRLFFLKTFQFVYPAPIHNTFLKELT